MRAHHCERLLTFRENIRGVIFYDHPAFFQSGDSKRLNLHQAGEQLVTNETPQV